MLFIAVYVRAVNFLFRLFPRVGGNMEKIRIKKIKAFDDNTTLKMVVNDTTEHGIVFG